ncbi:hypothetical protein [Nocardia brasiliensis]|uniref:hypothetical protein n=1 Tax=Nocardia brasiliensis TaxID=37326 RepID=UPI002456EA47|nr:hypothetical protein [Nocardia brasiliensis]
MSVDSALETSAEEPLTAVSARSTSLRPVGMLVGPIRPPIGRAAGAGLVLLMAGAVVGPLRNGDGTTEIVPAVGTAQIAAAYVATLTGGSR